MPREKDSFRNYVEFLQSNKWKCNFCNKEYGGSVTRIKAHLAGVGGYGIHGCKDINGQVKLEAQKALKVEGVAESNNGSKGNVEEGPHLPVTGSNEDARRETSFAAMPYPSFFDGASSSAFLTFPETNFPNQSLPTQIKIPQMDTSFWTQPPRSHASDSYIQPWNFSYPSSSRDIAPELLSKSPHSVNAEEGEPNTEVPQGDRFCGNSRQEILKVKVYSPPSKKKAVDQTKESSRQGSEPFTHEKVEESSEDLPMPIVQAQPSRPLSQKKTKGKAKKVSQSTSATPLRTSRKRLTETQVLEAEEEINTVPLIRTRRKVSSILSDTSGDVEDSDVDIGTVNADSPSPLRTDEIAKATVTSLGPEGKIILIDEPSTLDASIATRGTSCGFRPSYLESISLILAPTPLAEYDATRLESTNAFLIPRADNQDRLEDITADIHQTSSIQASSALLFLPAPGQSMDPTSLQMKTYYVDDTDCKTHSTLPGAEEVSLSTPLSPTSQVASSRFSPARQSESINLAIVEVGGPLSTSILATNPSSSSPGHPSAPPSVTQPLDRVSVEESLGSSAKAKLILEQVTRLLDSEAVDSSGSTFEPSSALSITDEVVKAKWLKFLEISKGGFPSVVDDPMASTKLKDLVNELCGGDIRFSKSPRFKKLCEDFLADFLSGIETYQQNYEKVISMVVLEKDYRHPHDSMKEASQVLKVNQTTLQTLVDERAALNAEEADLEQRLAKVRHQQKVKDIQMARVEEVLWKGIDSFRTLKSEKNRRDEEMAEKRRVRSQLLLENSRLDHIMTAFQEEVRIFVNNM